MKKHGIAILFAGTFWGLMGIFVRHLTDCGFDTPGVLFVRCSIAAVAFGIVILLKDPKQFRVALKDIWCFFGVGILSLLFFTYSYFRAINMMSLSAAGIMLYTAPAIVMLISLFVFHEKLTKIKVLALVMAFCGCALASGISGGNSSVTAEGIIYGLCSGLGYAMYSIFARLALDRGYSSSTVTFYATALAAVGSAVIWGISEPAELMFASAENIVWCIATGLVSCFLPYMLYTYGLKGMETGKASIMASVEPVVASIVGVLIFRERMDVFGLTGILLVLGAIAILNIKTENIKQSK